MPKTPRVYDHRVVLYVTEEDAAGLELAREQTGLSVSAYVRSLIRNDVERRRVTPSAPV